MLNSGIRLSVGFASARRWLRLGLHNTALSRQRLAFMVTSAQEALEGLERIRPGVLIVSGQLEQGLALVLVEPARPLVPDIRTILIVDDRQDDPVAGQSTADAVLSELGCFTGEQPLVTLIRSLALGRRYRSASASAAMALAAVKRHPWRNGPPELSEPELEIVTLLVEGLQDREIAEQLGIGYEAAHRRSKVLHRKLGAGSRAPLVRRARQLGLTRLAGGRGCGPAARAATMAA